MDLMLPEEWELDASSQGLLADIDEFAKQVNEIRPLSPEVVRQVNKQLKAKRVFGSNSVEGNTLSLRETEVILQTGSIMSEPKRPREAMEALNLGSACEHVESILHQSISDQRSILDTHQILMTGINDGIAGRYRNEAVMSRGAMYQPPDAGKVAELMDWFSEALQKHLNRLAEATPIVHPVVLASWTHWAIARVHPFVDGNGRMARLWQDLVLLRANLTVAIILPEDRTEYYDALQAADDGKPNRIIQLIASRVIRTFQAYLTSAEEADDLQGWASDIAGKAAENAADKRRLEYERWKLGVELVRDAFERCANRLSASGDGSLEVAVQRFDLIDQSVWESLRMGGQGRRTWFFRISFRSDRKRISFCFFFGRHYWSQADEGLDLQPNQVALLVSQQEPGEEEAISLDKCDRLGLTLRPGTTLREIFVVDRIVFRRVNDGTARIDADVEPIAIAKEFCEDVIKRKILAQG